MCSPVNFGTFDDEFKHTPPQKKKQKKNNTSILTQDLACFQIGDLLGNKIEALLRNNDNNFPSLPTETVDNADLSLNNHAIIIQPLPDKETGQRKQATDLSLINPAILIRPFSDSEAGPRKLVKHTITAKSLDPPGVLYTCTLCDQSFDQETVSNPHFHKCLTKTKGREFQACNKCHKIFPSRASLKSHIQEAHGAFICMLCGKTFAERNHLEKHLRQKIH